MWAARSLTWRRNPPRPSSAAATTDGHSLLLLDGQQRLAATEELLEARLASEDAARVVPDLEALVAEHPRRERGAGLLMVALYRTGRQADALAVHRRLREALLDPLRDDHRILAGLLRHLNRDRGPRAAELGRLAAPRLAERVPRVVRRRGRSVHDPRDTTEIHRLSVVDADDPPHMGASPIGSGVGERLHRRLRRRRIGGWLRRGADWRHRRSRSRRRGRRDRRRRAA